MAKGIIRTILDNHLEVAKYKEAMLILVLLLETDKEINLFIPEPHDSMINLIYGKITSLKKENELLKNKIAKLENSTSENADANNGNDSTCMESHEESKFTKQDYIAAVENNKKRERLEGSLMKIKTLYNKALHESNIYHKNRYTGPMLDEMKKIGFPIEEQIKYLGEIFRHF